MKKLSTIIIFLLLSFFCFSQGSRNNLAFPINYDQYAKVISKAHSLGAQTPSSDVQAAQRKFLNGLITDGIYAKSDMMKVFNSDGSRRFTDINWIGDVNSYKSTRNTNIKWNPFDGVTFDGSTDYIDLGWAPSNGVNYTQNSAEVVIYYSNFPTAFSNAWADGSRDAVATKQTAFNPANASTTIVSNVNMSSSSTTFNNSQFDLLDGLYFFGRNSSTNTWARKGSGTQQTATVTSSTPTTYNQTIGALNEAGTISSLTYANKTIAIYWVGAALTTTEEANFLSRWNTYLSDLATARSKVTVGNIYNVSSWSNLSDFSNNGSTCSVVSNALSFSGGAGTFTQSLDVFTSTVKDTKLAKWKMVGTFKVGTKTSTSFGFGMGIRSSSTTLSGQKIDALARFDMSTGTNTGKIQINAGSAHTQVILSTPVISFSVNDVISLTVELNEDFITADCYNVTTGSAVTHIAYTYTNAPPPNIPNTGRFAIFSLGGSFTCTSLTISTNEWKYPQVAALGDSKTQYYRASKQHNSWPYLLQDALKYPVVVNAGGADGSAEYVAHLNDLINIVHPQYVIIAGISNDIRAGVSSGTWQANLTSIKNTLISAGITPIFTDGLYETSVSQSAVTTWMSNTSNLPAANYLATVGTTLALYTDNIHPTDAGHLTYEALVYGANVLPK